jgi:hypothetical protein
MLRAVFVRTLKPGVSYEQFRDAWLPEGTDGSHPVTVTVSRNTANDRQVITLLEVDASPEEFAAISGSLARPDALERLNLIVESTEVAGVFEEVFDARSLSMAASAPDGAAAGGEDGAQG